MASNQEIAQTFADIADAMEVLGENRFRVAAYRKVSDTIAALTTSLQALHEQQALTSIAGIGDASAGIISEILETGSSAFVDELLTRVPPGLLDMLRVPEVGPKTAARLFHEEGITDLAALRAAASEGRLRAIKGFGAKTEARVLAAIDALQSRPSRLRLVDALPVMNELVAAIGNLDMVERVAPAGSLRRGSSSVGDLDLVAATADPEGARAALAALPQAASSQPTADGIDLALHNGMNVSLLLVPAEAWGSALVDWTGTRTHVEALQALAAERGWSFDWRGFQTPAGLRACADEAAVYAALDLPLIVPELREGWGEVAAAQRGELPSLIDPAAIRADLHWHTAWSDGKSSLREMVEAGRARGYSHMSVADHSAYLGVTGGLDADRLREQRAEIDALNAEYAAAGIDFRLLQGCEVDILPDGSLALPEAALAALDVVIASPHVALRQPREEATARMLRAIANPYVHIIGHPTGRLINERPGADLDMERLIAAAAANGTILEVNAGPERLDLDAPHVRAALAAGVRLTINTDAHDPRHLAGIDLGVLTARRGGASADAVVNTWPLERLTAHLAEIRRRKQA
jgi:DNA polymerase (family 10)